ncbi:MAG: hypothetical protein EOP88_19635 [Verrucomicrobiaceae bacterium]|nr:MAG: hypothetical protein EOP88_19635 [Verrucomicrobiaceae bacterium]
MKPGRIIIIFTTGLLAGWGLYGLAGPVRPVIAEPSTKADRTPIAKPTAKEDPRWSAFREKSRKADWGQMNAMLKEVVPGDRMAALEALAARPGLKGIGTVAIHLMEKITREWAAEDLDGAWAAAQKCQNEELREVMMGAILEQLAKTDPERALEMESTQVFSNNGIKSNLITMLQESKLRSGAADYIESIKRFPAVRTSSGSDEEFAGDFDFKLAADAVTALQKANDGNGPSSFPVNFMSEWAKKDPHAAFGWWAANPSLPFGDVNKVLEGFENHSPGSSTAWLVEKFQDPAMPREKLIAEWVDIDIDDLMPKVNTIAAALPDAQVADAFLHDVFVAKSEGVVEASAFALTGMSSPEARLAALRAMAAKYKSVDENVEMGEVTDEQLQAWGITREQAEKAIAK